MAASLTITGLEAGYGAVRILHGISLSVRAGETVALLGTNGNGKSTLMKCIMGLLRPTAGTITAELDGKTHDLTKMSTEEIVEAGIALVPEGRRLFPRLTVEENLYLGAFRKVARESLQRNLQHSFEAFPVLQERRRQLAHKGAIFRDEDGEDADCKGGGNFNPLLRTFDRAPIGIGRQRADQECSLRQDPHHGQVFSVAKGGRRRRRSIDERSVDNRLT